MREKRGTVAFVGSGEFLAPMEPVDRLLLEGLRQPARVAVVSTASVPDGEAVYQRWLKMGVEHFARLGAEAEAVPLRARADAEDPAVCQQLARADLIYLSGGKPPYLRDALQGTPAWRAVRAVYERGGVVAGCSAGAMVLAESMFDLRGGLYTVPALGLVAGVTIIPHFDEMPRFIEGFLAKVLEAVRISSSTVAGVEGNTALIRADSRWEVAGSGAVTVFQREGRQRYTPGETPPLPLIETNHQEEKR